MYHSEVWVTGGFLNHYGVHQAVWSLFPDDADAKRDFLYRVEARDPCGRVRLLLQSDRAPRTGTVAQVHRQRVLDPVAFEQGLYSFALVANPVRTESRRAAGRRHGRRQPITDAEARRAWLQRKLLVVGTTSRLFVHDLPPIRFRKPREAFRRGCIQPVLFTGLLDVTHPSRLAQLVCEGIGPAKGFGCGLLTVQPATAALLVG